MEIEPIEKIIRSLLKEYNKKPRGWFAFADKYGQFVFIGPTGAFLLKTLPLGGGRVLGVGAKIDVLEIKRSQKIPYGFRPLHKKDVQLLIQNLQRGVFPRSFMEKWLRRAPVETGRLKNCLGILNGPVFFTPDLRTIVKGQKELQKRLENEVFRLFKEKYPMRAGIYL